MVMAILSVYKLERSPRSPTEKYLPIGEKKGREFIYRGAKSPER